MSDEYKRHSTLTPAPVPTTKPATVGEVLAAVSDHKAECGAEQSSIHAHQWAEITAIKETLAGINGRLKTAVWIVGLGVALAGAVGTVGVFVAKYAIVGAITLELDKRIPPRTTEAPHTGPHYAEAQR